MDTFCSHHGWLGPDKLAGPDVSIYGTQMGPGVYRERWFRCQTDAPLGNSRGSGTERISAVWVTWFSLLVNWFGNFLPLSSVRDHTLSIYCLGMLLFRIATVSRAPGVTPLAV